MEKINNGAERKNLAETQGENLGQWVESLIRKNLFRLPEDALSGPHLEKAIVIVESTTHSVAPRDNDQEVFVFHETLHQERLEKLASNIIEALYEKTAIDRESLISALAKTTQEQMERTIQKLAPTLPVFRVSVSEKNEIKVRKEK